MATLLKDLIQIPERIHKDDFVLKLAEGVDRAEETLRVYVMTPQLEACFQDALGFVESALDSSSSKMTYLCHGLRLGLSEIELRSTRRSDVAGMNRLARWVARASTPRSWATSIRAPR